MQAFIAEVLSNVRANVSALGGNGLVTYRMSHCVLLCNPHKNQVTYVFFNVICWKFCSIIGGFAWCGHKLFDPTWESLNRISKIFSDHTIIQNLYKAINAQILYHHVHDTRKQMQCTVDMVKWFLYQQFVTKGNKLL